MSFTDEPFLSIVSGHNSRRQKELCEEKADQKRWGREDKEWEEAEAVADEYEFQEAVVAMRRCWNAARRRGSMTRREQRASTT